MRAAVSPFVCTKCGHQKPPTEFYRKPTGGYRARCRRCTIDYQSAYQRERAKALRDERDRDISESFTAEENEAAFWRGATPAAVPIETPFGVPVRMCYRRGNTLYMDFE